MNTHSGMISRNACGLSGRSLRADLACANLDSFSSTLKSTVSARLSVGGTPTGAIRTIALLCLFVILPAWANDEEVRVLVLNSLDPYLPAYMAIDTAMRANLAEEKSKRIVLYSELLDAQRFSEESLEPEVLALLAKKYKSRKIDVVVTVMQPALDFYMQHGDALWPGARVVFHGIPDLAVEPRPLPPGAVGLVNQDDFEGTVRIAQRLQPNARRILVIAGTAPLDRELLRRARDLVPPVAGKAEVEFLDGVPLPALLKRVEAEPADTIILFLSQFRDREGRPYYPRELLRTLSNASAAPIYGLFETLVGSGIATGSMEIYADRGRRLGDLVRASLNGKAYPEGKRVFSVSSRCVADAKAMQRWSLDEDRLPSGCEVRFADRPLWRQYWWQLTLAFAVLVGQSLLLVTLLNQRRRRRIAEVEVLHQRTELAHASRLATLGELSASIAHEVNQPLGAISSNADAVELLLDAEPPKLEDARRVLLDLKNANQRASSVVLRIRGLLRKRELIFEVYDLNAVVADTVRLLDTDARARGVQIFTEIGSLPVVRGDRLQFQQVLLNLLVNAMDAMAGTPAGRRHLKISTSHTEDRDVEVAVADTGGGLDAADMSRLFDSFFTTKRDGMGLGLALCRSIVQAHGGRIWAENNEDGGATFRFVLPIDAEHRVRGVPARGRKWNIDS